MVCERLGAAVFCGGFPPHHGEFVVRGEVPAAAVGVVFAYFILRLGVPRQCGRRSHGQYCEKPLHIYTIFHAIFSKARAFASAKREPARRRAERVSERGRNFVRKFNAPVWNAGILSGRAGGRRARIRACRRLPAFRR